MRGSVGIAVFVRHGFSQWNLRGFNCTYCIVPAYPWHLRGNSKSTALSGGIISGKNALFIWHDSNQCNLRKVLRDNVMFRSCHIVISLTTFYHLWCFLKGFSTDMSKLVLLFYRWKTLLSSTVISMKILRCLL